MKSTSQFLTKLVSQCRLFLYQSPGLLCILALIILLRIPNLLEPLWYGDEAITMTVGRALRHGDILYRDIQDNKTPFLYIIAALTYTLPKFKLALALFSLTSIYIFWQLARQIIVLHNSKEITRDRAQLYQFVSTLFFALFTTLPWFEGNIANGEIFMIVPTMSAVYLFLRSQNQTRSSGHLSSSDAIKIGILFSLGFLFKHPAATDALAIVCFLYVHQSQFFPSVSLLKSYSLLFLSFLAPGVLILSYFFMVGALGDFLNSVFVQNFSYLASWSTGQPVYQASSAGSSGLLIRLICSLFSNALIVVNYKKFGRPLSFLTLWLIWSLFGALLSGRPYAHYLIQIAPAFSLIIFVPILIRKRVSIFLSGASFCSLFILWQFIPFWTYSTVNYYQNALAYLSGNKSIAEYYRAFDSEAPTLYYISSQIQQHIAPNSRMYVWGDQPAIYVLSDTLPAAKYITAYHTRDFAGYAKVVSGLSYYQAPYIITNTKVPLFPELQTILSEQYVLDQHIGNYQIYVRK